ncbi:nudix hydrolase 20, chloroplastic-like [Quillaja saponaria]|uniref:Nudix hydrolase 20, chloroplastic-like n=1 Tax=Quillaja saponaria TaxID=32244 RepID=A0AAD7PWR2_QUISA|nr:nudix hydrolase 20, chloroplastic-like [Quillaja saponaria]
MASTSSFALSCRCRTSLTFSSLFNFKFSHPFPVRFAASFPLRINAWTHSSIKYFASSSISSANDTFTWDDVLHISPSPDDSSDLRGYFEKVHLCNRGSELQSEFLPFVIEDQIVGYIHNGFADRLRSFTDVFVFPKDSSYGGRFSHYVTLHPMLGTPEDRTSAVGDVVKSLGEEWSPHELWLLN